MRLGAVTGELRLEERAEEEGVPRELDDPDLPAVILPAGHPLAGRRALRLPDLADSRWIEAEQVAPPLAEIRRHAGVEGFRPFLHYDGEDIMAVINLSAAGHGLTLLPEPVIRAPGIATVRVTEPRVSHRVELLHAALRADSPAAALADILTER